MRVQLPDEQFFITAALPAKRAILHNIPIAAAAACLDFINLEAYDFYGPWTAKSGHQAQLYSLSGSSSSSSSKDETSGSSGVSYLISHGCPARKILLGIPLYGRSFLGVAGPGHRHKGQHGGDEDGAFEYSSLPRKGAKETVDRRIGAASCVGGDGGFVTYDNPETVKMKAAYCKQKGLGVSFSLSYSPMYCLSSYKPFLMFTYHLPLFDINLPAPTCHLHTHMPAYTYMNTCPYLTMIYTRGYGIPFVRSLPNR